MALDVYSPCPCGSNKKLKFCCHGIEADIERVVRHQSAKQYKQALQVLMALERTNPQSAWVKNLAAFTLMMDRRAPEAKAPLAKVLETQPDNLYSISLFGLASFLGDGWKAGKMAIQRAFQRCSAEYPHIVYFLARSIAEFMAGSGSVLAHRQYLALAMRLANEENRENVFVELIDFDGDTKIPYVLRGSHDLVPVAGDEAFEKEIRKGAKLAFLGCNEAAAGIFGKLAEAAAAELAGLSGDDAMKKRSLTADLWWNCGICQAWDGDEKSAAESLHKSAKLTADFEVAVERETLAQNLERRGDRDSTHRVVQRTYKAKSVSRLLTQLDSVPQFARMPKPEGQQADPRQPAANYRVLSKDAITESNDAAFTLDTVPTVLADIVIFDRNDATNQDAGVAIIGIEGPTFSDSVAKFESAAGGEIEKVELPGSDNGVVTNSMFEKEFLPLQWRRHYDPATPMGIIRRINREVWKRFLDLEWANTPLSALGGKTPQEAIGDDALRVPLAAWLQQLDMYGDRFGLPYDVNEGRAKYKLPALQTLDMSSDDNNVGTLSILQFARLPFDKLDDSQLVAAFKRATLVQHKGSLKQLLVKIVERPSCHDKLDVSRVYRFLSDISALLSDSSEAIQWLNKERERQVPVTEQFEHSLDCDMRELRYRLDTPHTEECNNLLRRMWDYYGAKVPEVRGYVTNVVTHYRIAAPWMAAASEPALAGVGGAVTSGGIWTPDATANQPAAAGKLWVPGS